jgi:O-antigen/teichoic acid export membrane protein
LTRKREYLSNLSSAYIVVFLQIGYGLAAIPLALEYLGEARFGVWAVAAQVAMWLQLFDAGMHGSLGRYLIDFRLDETPERRNAAIGTGFRIALVQSFCIAMVALIIGNLLTPVLKIPANEAAEFSKVLTVLGLNGAFIFLGKPLQSWFYACRRLDVANWIVFISTLLEWLTLWWMLRSGHGLMSLAYARSVSAVVTLTSFLVTGIKYYEFPIRALRHPFDPSMFRKIGKFAMGFFFLTLGTQLFTATQAALVSRNLGVAVAAVWLAAPKLFMLSQQMIVKIWDYSVPGLSDKMARQEIAAIGSGLQLVFRSTALIAGVSLGCVVAVNDVFLDWWTSGRLGWEMINSVFMGLLVYSVLLVRCFTDFVVNTKRIGYLSLLMVLEGVVFVAGSSLLMPKFGLSGMIVTATLSGLIFRLPYSIIRIRAYLNLDAKDARAFLLSVFGGLLVGVITYGSVAGVIGLTVELSQKTRLFSAGLVGAVLGALTIWRGCLNDQQRASLRKRIASKLGYAS